MSATETIAAPLPPAPPQFWGYLVEFNDVDSLLAAANKVREAGYSRWDCYTPFPVHGLDKAMGIRPTILPWLVLGAGLTGLTIALAGQWYVNNYQGSGNGIFSGYPQVFSGKPYWSIPMNIPVAFEVTVLLSCLTTFFGLWTLCKLPQLYHPVFNVQNFRRVTDDGFFIAIEATDPRFSEHGTRALVESLGAVSVEEIKD